MRWILLLFALSGLAAALPETLSPAQVERLLRQGRTAYDQGDYTTALRWLERAESHTEEPAPVTFALASTYLQLALNGGEEATGRLKQGEELFRCLIAPNQPYRVRGLLGLGSCLLLKATRQRDHAACTEALQRLEECVQLQPEEPLGGEARRLFHRARLLEWQLLPPLVDSQPKDPPSGEPEKTPMEKEKPPEKAPGEKDPNGPKGPMGTKPVATEDPKGTAQEKKDGPQGTRAAEGNQPGVQDRKPLSAPPDRAVALQRLQEATRRIQAEQKVFRKSLVRPPVEGVPDW